MNFTHLSIAQVVSATLVLFAVIDILGSIPIVISFKEKTGHLYAGKATIVSGAIMIVFLFLGDSILNLFSVDLKSFALAGSFIIFLIAIEMILGITLFKSDPHETDSASIVPLAFPLIAGAGTLTTLLSIRSTYYIENIIIAILINAVFIYVVLKSIPWIEKRLGLNGRSILRRVFGIILLSIAIKLFTTNLALYPFLNQ